MSVETTTIHQPSWRSAVLSALFGLLFCVAVLAIVGGYWLLDWTYGEETMISVAANAILVTPRLLLMSISSIFGARWILRTSVSRTGIMAASVTVAAIMFFAILNWQRFLSTWYTSAFYGVSAVEIVAAVIIGFAAGAAGAMVALLTSSMRKAQ